MSGVFYEGGWECPKCGAEFDEDRKSSIFVHKYQRHGLDTDSYIERYKQIREEIPDKYGDAYEELTGSGRAPKIVQAAVYYIESEATMDEAAEIFDKTDNSIRSMVNDLIDRDVVTLEEVRENNVTNGWQKFGENRWRGENQSVNESDDAPIQYDHNDIQEIRESYEVTQRELANRVGVSSQAVREWEKEDSYNPAPPTAEKIAREFGT